jgi:hypothetical protein
MAYNLRQAVEPFTVWVKHSSRVYAVNTVSPTEVKQGGLNSELQHKKIVKENQI